MVGGPGPFEQRLKVTAIEIKNDRVRLGFEADAAIPVHRWEVWKRIRAGIPPLGLGEDAAEPVAG